ncbi:MAG: AsnC family transcriptional regulator [Gallionellaceae bacterium]|nr:AsnC family transcriptional regulator [Gallionellaceae bacterium]MDD5364553.1 AsnC family transcriptional regulator [Gallionellaceae bacterium]
MKLDATDRRLVITTQAGLALTPEPYRAVAEQLGIAPEEVMRRLLAMHKAGVLRRIGAVPNHYALGYRANGMTVWDVADDRVDGLGERVGQLAFVSHCYRRPRRLPDWPYNLFAMVHGHDRAEVEAYRAEIQSMLGEACRSHDVLYSTGILKKTGLRIGG